MASAKEALVQTLRDSASQIDHARVRDATTRLEEWRTGTGFFSTLQVRAPSSFPSLRFWSILSREESLECVLKRALNMTEYVRNFHREYAFSFWDLS
jgi:hypothetical protein